MYEKKQQLDFDDFIFPIGKLDPENAWIKLAKMIPWEKIEKKYAEHFKNNGYPAFNVRVALGALIIIATSFKH